MLTKSFVFGNGESRASLDLNKFKQYGVTIGCNAIYRDYSPDILVATDPGMIAEICASNYPEIGICYFRQWSPIPIDYKEQFVTVGDYKVIDHTENTDAVEFCMIGTEDLDSKENKIAGTVYLIPVRPSFNCKDLKSIGCDLVGVNQFATYEFTGPYAIDISAKFSDVVYIFGMDMGGTNSGKTNNMYKDSENYSKSEQIENPKLKQSIEEIKDVFTRNPNTNFIRVGPIFLPIAKEFKDLSNVEFITYEAMCADMQIDESTFKLKANKKEKVNKE